MKLLINVFRLSLTALVLNGCMALGGLKEVPLVHSSLDMNQGVSHTMIVSSMEMSTLLQRINTLGEKRDLILLQKQCSSDGSQCELTYKRKNDEKSKTVGSGYNSSNRGTGAGKMAVSTYNMSFSSRLFVSAKQTENGIRLEMIGVPVINESLSCPHILVQRQVCVTQGFYVRDEQTPAESFQGLWGVDISGRTEADLITGIFAELEMRSY